MKDYHCPSCGDGMIRELENGPKGMLYCKCGMVFRVLTSDIHYIPVTDRWTQIREVLDSSIVFYQRKDEKWNDFRAKKKEKVIEYLVSELKKGPIEGGTMAEVDSLCFEFGTMIWTGLQRAVLLRDEKCMICGQRPSQEVHHIRPRHLKGKDHPRNLVGLCLECHDEVHRRIDEGIQATLEQSFRISVPRGQTTLDNLNQAEVSE